MAGLNYDKVNRMSSTELSYKIAGSFPNCKGFFPDCPNEPSLTNSMCRTCPKTDGIKKPKIESD